jgi:hypothetical protein
VKVEITDEEQALLQRVLEEFYAELREEIYKTEEHSFRDRLKRDEVVVQELIRKLGGTLA